MQEEKPAPSLDALEAMLGKRPTYASGGQIKNFREGWAYNIMGAGKAVHYCRRNSFDKAVALCGKWIEARWLYGPGNYPQCKTCKRAKGHNVELSGREEKP